MGISVDFDVFLIQTSTKNRKNLCRKKAKVLAPATGISALSEYPFGSSLTSKLDAPHAEDANPIPLSYARGVVSLRTSYIKKSPPFGQEFFDMAPATGIEPITTP